MREKLPNLEAPGSIAPVVEQKKTAPGRHAIRAHASMYQLPGNPPLTDKDFKRYEQRNEALDGSLPKLINHFLTTESVYLWAVVARLINETTASTQSVLRQQLAGAIGNLIAQKLGRSELGFLPLLLYLSPAQRSDILAATLAGCDSILDDFASDYIQFAAPSDRARLVDLVWLKSSKLTRIGALQGANALPEAERARVVQRGLRDPMIAVVLTAAGIIDRLSSTEQSAARALIPAAVQRAFQEQSPDNVCNAATIIHYAPVPEQAALRDQLYTLLKTHLDVPPLPTTPAYGPRLRWVLERWDAQVRDIALLFKLAKAIDEAPAARQAELRALIPGLLREGMAENQSSSNQISAVSAIQYAPVEVRGPFISAALYSKDFSVRQTGVDQIRYAAEPERASLMLRALSDKSVSVRLSAAGGLACVPESERAPLILQALKDPDTDVRMIMMEEEACIPLAAWPEIIEAGMRSTDEAVVYFASSHLCYIPDEEAERIRGQYPNYFKDLSDLASRTRLYEQAGDEPFVTKPFPKTGSFLALVDRPLGTEQGESLRERIITRTIPTASYFPWRKAFEAVEVWKALGFDYVPIEPIVSVTSRQYALTITVTAGVINGPSAAEWQAQGGTCMGEIVETIDKIYDGLEKLNIDHKHPHYHNFVLLFDRDEHSTPIITSPPRVYLIDFDQAEMKLPRS